MNQIASTENIAMDFGGALKNLRLGLCVARAGWNGKGMFLFLVKGSRFTVNRPPLLGIYPPGTEISYHSHIDMKTADGTVVPWLASQTDMLAEDWQVVTPPAAAASAFLASARESRKGDSSPSVLWAEPVCAQSVCAEPLEAPPAEMQGETQGKPQIGPFSPDAIGGLAIEIDKIEEINRFMAECALERFHSAAVRFQSFERDLELIDIPARLVVRMLRDWRDACVAGLPPIVDRTSLAPPDEKLAGWLEETP